MRGYSNALLNDKVFQTLRSMVLSVRSVTLSVGMLLNSFNICDAWFFNVVSVSDFLVDLDWHFSFNSVGFINEDLSGSLSGDSVGNLDSVSLVN